LTNPGLALSDPAHQGWTDDGTKCVKLEEPKQNYDIGIKAEVNTQLKIVQDALTKGAEALIGTLPGQKGLSEQMYDSLIGAGVDEQNPCQSAPGAILGTLTQQVCNLLSQIDQSIEQKIFSWKKTLAQKEETALDIWKTYLTSVLGAGTAFVKNLASLKLYLYGGRPGAGYDAALSALESMEETIGRLGSASEAAALEAEITRRVESAFAEPIFSNVRPYSV